VLADKTFVPMEIDGVTEGRDLEQNRQMIFLRDTQIRFMGNP
jgi:hypothetical protein